MKIKEFIIEKLFNLYDVKLDFYDDVTVFVGENGMGKTTILNCLYYTLTGQLNKLNSFMFKTIKLKLADTTLELNKEELDKYISNSLYLNNRYAKYFEIIDMYIEGEQDLINLRNSIYHGNSEIYEFYINKISHYLGMNRMESRRILDRYIRYASENENEGFNKNNIINFKKEIKDRIGNNVIYFPTYRRIEEELEKLDVDDEDIVRKNDLIKFGMRDVEKIINNILQTIKSDAINSFTEMTGVLIKQYTNKKLTNKSYKIDKEKLSIVLERIGEKIGDKEKKKIFEMIETKQIYQDENKYLLNLIKNLISSYEQQQANDEKIKAFVSVCNKYLNGKQYIYDESKVEIGIYKGDIKLSIQNLSSGEKQIISTFAKLYLEENDENIILFDEPELSLSLNWQKMFLPDVYKSQKCSLLVAITHSPFIFDNEFDDKARNMKNCISE